MKQPFFSDLQSHQGHNLLVVLRSVQGKYHDIPRDITKQTIESFKQNQQQHGETRLLLAHWIQTKLKVSPETRLLVSLHGLERNLLMKKATAICLKESTAIFYLSVTLLKEVSELQITGFPTSDENKETKEDMELLQLKFSETAWKMHTRDRTSLAPD